MKENTIKYSFLKILCFLLCRNTYHQQHKGDLQWKKQANRLVYENQNLPHNILYNKFLIPWLLCYSTLASLATGRNTIVFYYSFSWHLHLSLISNFCEFIQFFGPTIDFLEMQSWRLGSEMRKPTKVLQLSLNKVLFGLHRYNFWFISL